MLMSTAAPEKPPTAAKQAYRYSVEIAQMCYVFGETSDPSEDVVKFIEDTVRLQITDLILQARLLSSRRLSRHLSVEDLVFLIRHDLSLVARLRSFLSWKDVRAKVKESEQDDDFGEPGSAEDGALSARRIKVRFPWDVVDVFSDVLGDGLLGEEEEEEEGEEGGREEREAWEASKGRLEAADELTRNMTKEQYQHYSDCRQSSFTYRKAKRFREFINLSLHLEGTTPTDDIIDVLGFLSYELVRSLVQSGTAFSRSTALSLSHLALASSSSQLQAPSPQQQSTSSPTTGLSPSSPHPKSPNNNNNNTSSSNPSSSNPKKREAQGGSSSSYYDLIEPSSLFSAPEEEVAPPTGGLVTPVTEGVTGAGVGGAEGGGALTLEEITGGMVRRVEGRMALKAGGMRNWRGGVKRIKVGFI